MYRLIDEALTLTRYAYAPDVALSAPSEHPTSVAMLYRSAPLDRTGGARRTKLTFRNVLDFRFREHELGLSWTDLDSSKFGLIEIEASELLAQFVAAGRVRSRSSGSIKEADLRHYRIVFDDHGRYDIVCTNLQIETII